MLAKLVERTCDEIDNLDLIGPSLDDLRLQIEEHASEVIAATVRANQHSRKKATHESAAKGVAFMANALIKSVPPIARQMMQAIGNRRLEPPRRCAIAGILQYLVQPHDMIPDDAPGGYGFLDDTIFLRAGLVEYLNTLPGASSGIEYEQRVVGTLVNLAPEHVRPLLQQSVAVLSAAVDVLAQLGDDIAEMTLARIIADPLQNSVPSAPRGFRPRNVPNYADGHWSGGNYFEGNNVVIPGGPSLIDGQLFIPR